VEGGESQNRLHPEKNSTVWRKGRRINNHGKGGRSWAKAKAQKKRHQMVTLLWRLSERK